MTRRPRRTLARSARRATLAPSAEVTMPGKTFKIRSREGGEFDCYLALPQGSGPTPAVVLACAIVGVDKDLCDIADEFAAQGYIAAAPDLFWRSVPGPLDHSDSRTRPRGQPR